MILVTGATGLVGAHVCLALLEENKPLVALYRREKKREVTRTFFEAKNRLALFDKIIWRKADLTHLPDLTLAFKDITEVYHCAAYISMGHHKLHELQQTNQLGSSYIANLCIENNIEKLGYISSIAALGSYSTTPLIDEETSWNPTLEKTPYAYSKYGAELEIWRASQEGVPVVIVNPGVILGEGMPRSPQAQLRTKINQGLRFYPTGKTGYVVVEDVVKAIIRLMHSPIKNERFILVAENLSYQKIIQILAEIAQKKNPRFPLKKSLLQLAWALESLVSILGLRKKFLTKALINSLCDTKEIDGRKIVDQLNFSYTPIEAYLKNGRAAQKP